MWLIWQADGNRDSAYDGCYLGIFFNWVLFSDGEVVLFFKQKCPFLFQEEKKKTRLRKVDFFQGRFSGFLQVTWLLIAIAIE